MIFEELVNYIF